MTLKERADALARVPVFAGLSRASLERIARITKDVELRAGEDARPLPGDHPQRLPEDPRRRAEGGDPGPGDRGDAARLAALSASSRKARVRSTACSSACS